MQKDKEIKMCFQLPVSINSTDVQIIKIDLIKTILETQLPILNKAGMLHNEK